MRGIFLAAIVVLTGAAPAAAFDCAKASTRIEKAICANPKLKAADDAMAGAYRALREKLGEPERTGLVMSQRLWLKERESDCDWRDGKELDGCIADMTRARTSLLGARPEAGPGLPGETIPVFVARKGTPKTYEIDVAMVKFADPVSPGMAAFNAEVDKLLADVPLDEEIDFDSAGQVYYHASLTIAYGSPKLVSGSGGGWRYDGGAHGNPWSFGINVDLEAGRLLSADDLFTAEQMAALAEDCRDQIVRQKIDGGSVDSEAAARENLNMFAETFDQVMSDLAAWVFHGAKAVVTFDPYEIGAYAEGSFACELPYSTLRARTLRPDLLPPG